MHWKEVMGYYGCLDERLFWRWVEAVSQHPDIVSGLGAEQGGSGRRRLNELLRQGGFSGWQRGGPNLDLAASRGAALTSCRVVDHRTVAGRVELFMVHVTSEPSGEWCLSKQYADFMELSRALVRRDANAPILEAPGSGMGLSSAWGMVAGLMDSSSASSTSGSGMRGGAGVGANKSVLDSRRNMLDVFMQRVLSRYRFEPSVLEFLGVYFPVQTSAMGQPLGARPSSPTSTDPLEGLLPLRNLRCHLWCVFTGAAAVHMRLPMPYREVCKVKTMVEWVSAAATKGSHATAAADGRKYSPRPTYTTRAKSTQGSARGGKAGDGEGGAAGSVAVRQYKLATQSLERIELDLGVVAETSLLSTNEVFVLKRMIFNLLLLEPTAYYSRYVLV